MKSPGKFFWDKFESEQPGVLGHDEEQFVWAINLGFTAMAIFVLLGVLIGGYLAAV